MFAVLAGRKLGSLDSPMIKIAALFLCVLGFAGRGAYSAIEPLAPALSPQENLDTMIAHGIRLLERRQYREFVESYFDPDLLRRLEPRDVGNVVKGFAEKADNMLAALKLIRGSKPAFEDLGRKAIFAIPANPQGLTQPLVFKRLASRWHLESSQK